MKRTLAAVNSTTTSPRAKSRAFIGRRRSDRASDQYPRGPASSGAISPGTRARLGLQQFHALTAVDLDGVVIDAPLVQPTRTTFPSLHGTLEVSGLSTHAGASALAHQVGQAR